MAEMKQLEMPQTRGRQRIRASCKDLIREHAPSPRGHKRREPSFGRSLQDDSGMWRAFGEAK
eukprot:CAMPEP_0198722862 /NCGR_PEP_ID=MMETSP1475-20131203/461_1 /TAXON_ID= ORGANISM="Unidentified sp., Strain CCMP1999" /NCGR_SAMPLE_ID=MMETSP1475 /ASSEMBLY_ACC=CAM_ASM_001111 /LENGTH=61 /DNA_ID=CAMNT_0044483797 /DNA_START=90 /DNA_END=275 /DNA_ORIENTATION=+